MQTPTPNYQPEVLAPVGNWDMCMAAVHNGANAIYVGMPGFNARARSYDHSFDELEKIIQYCRLYGVKVHVAFNILIFEKELHTALAGLKQLLPLQPDAIICQDIGLVRLIKTLNPQQVIHASTQMTISSAEHIAFLSDLDMERYVLARENSLDEMRNIRSKTDKELEVFVHGALCVAYSGQCLTSESMGGRSANRGQCSQSCRLDYELRVNDQVKDMGAKKYLVSPKDLFAVDMVKDLMDLKIDSFKIEGRYKAAEYVAQASKTYANAIQQAQGINTVNVVDPDDLKVAFSRDFFSGWLHGVNHNELVDGRFSGHRGLHIGSIVSIQSQSKFPTLLLQCKRNIQAGDSLIFTDHDEQMVTAAKVFEVRLKNNNQEVSFDKTFNTSLLKKDHRVYLNRSPKLDKHIQQSWTDKHQQKRIQLSIEVLASEGKALDVIAYDEDGHECRLQSDFILERASKKALSEEQLLKHFQALSGSVYRLGHFTASIAGSLFIPDKVIKQCRQRLTKMFDEQRLALQPTMMHNQQAQAFIEKKVLVEETHEGFKLNVLIREEEQLEALKDLPINTVYLDYKYGQRYQRSVDKIRALGFKAGIVSTRVFKAGKEKLLGIIDRIKPDVVLLRNAGAFYYFQEKYGNEIPFELVGDFSFNITNHLSADYFLTKGLTTLTPSYDLNFKQLQEFLSKGLAKQSEITIHQYMPSFHMEHCVFASFLSDGSSIKDCGMPCLHNNVEIVDKKHVAHPVLADQECRNTMFNGTPQSAASLIPQLQKIGVHHYRIEALSEDAATLRKKIIAYLDVLEGKRSAKALYKELGIIEKYGISEGQQQNLDVYQARKKLST